MKCVIIAFALLGLAATTMAECPNACSGHGECGKNDNCNCDPNWMANDCSQRVCPHGLAWVDTPRGDFNHNGNIDDDTSVKVRFSSGAAFEEIPDPAVDNYGHFYMECSNRGMCDRTSGECQCFPGYSGASCQRSTCPNDCSGHGVCRTVAEVAAGAMTKRMTHQAKGVTYYSGVENAFDYRLWDAEKAQTCVCDPGYTGADCTLRECPRGDDPLTHRKEDCGGNDCAKPAYTLVLDGDLDGVELKFHFTDDYNQAWSSKPIALSGDLSANGAGALVSRVNAGKLQAGLRAMPNGVLHKVKVTESFDGSTSSTFTLTFPSGSHEGRSITVSLTDLSNDPTATPDLSTTPVALTKAETGNLEYVVCSNRGLCDYETGLCKCFKGYYADDCSVQNALAM